MSKETEKNFIVEKTTEKFIQAVNELENLQIIKSKTELAKAIDVQLSEISDIMNGRRNASKKILSGLVDYYNINANFLFRDEPHMFYIKGSKASSPSDGIITVTIDETGKENVLYVPVRAYASYIEAFNDPVYLKDMPAFKAPFLSQHGVRVFEVERYSMVKPTGEGIHPGDSLWCTQVFKPHDIHNGRVHVIWTESTGMAKRLNYDKRNDYISCRSDNPNDPPFRIPLSEVKEIWYAHGLFTYHMPPPGTVDTRLTDHEIRISKLENTQLKTIELLKTVAGDKFIDLSGTTE